MRKITSSSLKKIGTPRTQKEKYDYLNRKNPSLEKLKNVFGLEVTL